jgi:hypothetical protein
MIQQLDNKQVNWALVCHDYMDNRPELEFRITHKLLWEHLLENFARTTTNLPPNCELMQRKSK